jgi:hypothetical protein
MTKRWKLEISDAVTSYTIGGRRYLPGVYVLTSKAVAEAASRSRFGIYVTPLVKGEKVVEGRYGTTVKPGPLTLKDLKKNDPLQACAECGGEFKNVAQHYRMSGHSSVTAEQEASVEQEVLSKAAPEGSYYEEA